MVKDGVEYSEELDGVKEVNVSILGTEVVTQDQKRYYPVDEYEEVRVRQVESPANQSTLIDAVADD